MVVDAVAELGAYLDELPADASALDAKLARQAQLRTLTRKYAADIDGVLRWADEARARLAQLDVSEEGLAALERRTGELAHELAKPQLISARSGGRRPSGWPRRSARSCPPWRWPMPNSPSV